MHEAFDLLTSSIFEGFGTAEVDGVGFDQLGIELVLADDLAEPVADLVSGTVAAAVSVDAFGWKLLCIRKGTRWTGIGADLLDRADADAIGLPQSTIDGSGLGYAHLGAADQERDVGRVGIAVADETGGTFGRIHGRLKDEPTGRGITQRIDRLDMDTAASLATCQPNQSGVSYKPAIVKLDYISAREREAELFGQIF